MHAEYNTLFHKETQGLVGTECPYAGNETIVVSITAVLDLIKCVINLHFSSMPLQASVSQISLTSKLKT